MASWNQESMRVPEFCDDQDERERLRQAFGCLEPNAALDERIMAMTRRTQEASKPSWTHRVPARFAAAAALTVALVGSGAYAATQTNFFAMAFGDKGQESVAAHKVTDEVKGSTLMAPAREWVGVDPQEAEQLIGSYVQPVGQGLELNGYELTVHDVVMDANGLGVATYTLANPQGVGESDAGYGEVYMGPDAEVGDVFMRSTAGAVYDNRSVRDNSQSTKDELHAVFYFASPDGAPLADEALQWGLLDLQTTGVLESGTTEGVSIAQTAPTRTFTAANGATVSFSALGLVLGGVEDDGYWDALQGLTLDLSDGSTYVVEDDNTVNAVFGLGRANGETTMLFNRLIDPEAVVRITVDLHSGERLTFEA